MEVIVCGERTYFIRDVENLINESVITGEYIPSEEWIEYSKIVSIEFIHSTPYYPWYDEAVIQRLDVNANVYELACLAEPRLRLVYNNKPFTCGICGETSSDAFVINESNSDECFHDYCLNRHSYFRQKAMREVNKCEDPLPQVNFLKRKSNYPNYLIEYDSKAYFSKISGKFPRF